MDLKEARIKAMNLLARREHSAHELVQKLARKGLLLEDADALITTLRSDRLQSDERYAEAQVRVGVSKGHGPIRIAQHLKQHQIDEQLISQLLYEQSIDWFEQARLVKTKRFGEALPEAFQDKAKQQRFLQYRGFSSDHIASVYS